MRRYFVPGIFLYLVLTWPVRGLVVFQSATSTDNDFNTTVPGSGSAAEGAPWEYIAQQNQAGIIESTAVYLGNGFVLTANHAGAPSQVLLGTEFYTPDPSFAPISFTPTDLRLYKILNPPPLALLPLTGPNDADTSKLTVLMGWGKGKGSIINEPGAMGDKGWLWGGSNKFDEVSKNKRWGTNTTTSTGVTISYDAYSFTALKVIFDNASGANEATAAIADSGGPFFQKIGSVWKLAGTITSVDGGESYENGAALYSPSGARSATYAVRLRSVAEKLRFTAWKEARSIAVGESDTLDTDGDGLGLLEEYAYGTDPAVPSAGAAPVAGIDGEDATLTYQRERTRTDLQVEVEECTDFTDWGPATVSSTDTVGDNGTIRTYRAHVPQNDAERKFLRLKITPL